MVPFQGSRLESGVVWQQKTPHMKITTMTDLPILSLVHALPTPMAAASGMGFQYFITGNLGFPEQM